MQEDRKLQLTFRTERHFNLRDADVTRHFIHGTHVWTITYIAVCSRCTRRTVFIRCTMAHGTETRQYCWPSIKLNVSACAWLAERRRVSKNLCWLAVAVAAADVWYEWMRQQVPIENNHKVESFPTNDWWAEKFSRHRITYVSLPM